MKEKSGTSKDIAASIEKKGTSEPLRTAAASRGSTDGSSHSQGPLCKLQRSNTVEEGVNSSINKDDTSLVRRSALWTSAKWIISTLVTGLIAFTAGYYANKVNDDRKDNRDATSKAAFISELKSIVAASCVKQVAEFNYMIRTSKEVGMIGLNAYLLPKFPNSLKDLLIASTSDIIVRENEFATLLPVLGRISYESTFSTKDASGTVFGTPVYNYIHDVDLVCKWASGKSKSENMFDLGLIP